MANFYSCKNRQEEITGNDFRGKKIPQILFWVLESTFVWNTDILYKDKNKKEISQETNSKILIGGIFQWNKH